jgi:hypothetical protein
MSEQCKSSMPTQALGARFVGSEELMGNKHELHRGGEAAQVVRNVPHAPVGSALLGREPGRQNTRAARAPEALQVQLDLLNRRRASKQWTQPPKQGAEHASSFAGHSRDGRPDGQCVGHVPMSAFI